MSGLDDRSARLHLAHLVEPGDWHVHAAVQQLGAVEVAQALTTGRAVPGVTAAVREGARVRAEGFDPAEARAAVRRAGARLVVPGDPEWPEAQLTWAPAPLLGAPPLGLLLRGPASLAELAQRAVAVVGARAATAYGEHVARSLADTLAGRGHPVISGAAYGIDGAAHRGALAAEGAGTAAVLACGVDVAYPRAHDRLLDQIGATGLVVSEHLPGAHPTRVRFLVRNRLIAALSRGTVVVEADVRSGSLATARRAGDLHRHVMAVPGPVTSRSSAGCHQLLRDEGAELVVDAEQVIALVGPVDGHEGAPRRGEERPRDGLSETVRRVLDAVPYGVGPDVGAGELAIARDAGVAVLTVQQVLPPLLVHGLVERCEVGWRLTSLGAERPARRAGRA